MTSRVAASELRDGKAHDGKISRFNKILYAGTRQRAGLAITRPLGAARKALTTETDREVERTRYHGSSGTDAGGGLEGGSHVD